MKRYPVILLLLAFVAGGFNVLGCGDINDPMYWTERISDRSERELALKRIAEIFSTLKQKNNNNLSAPAIKEFAQKIVPELIAVFKELKRDRINRLELMKMIAQFNLPIAKDLYLDNLDVSGASDQHISQVFVISANALGNVGVAEALPKLLAAHETLVAGRMIRGGIPFTTRENELELAIVNALIPIILKNPQAPERAKVVEALCQIADTRDTIQDLRINMKAVKGLGQIGDSAAIPTLIRAIAMQGEVQKVGLGQFAFVSLQQIMDRDAVVEAIIKFAKGQDKAFNDYFSEEIKTDPMLKVPVWSTQQAIDFLGLLNYPSPKAIEFLVSELNHTEVDEMDKVSGAKGEGSQAFSAEQWVKWRQNWAAVALSQLGHKPVLEKINERFTLKKTGDTVELATTVEEAAGFLRALGYLQYPNESCPLLLDVAKTGSEALRDKTYYYSALMCGEEFLPIMKPVYDKIDCKKIVEERIPEDAPEEEKTKAEGDCNTLKDRIKTYMGWIAFSKGCGQNLDCFLKVIPERSNPNVEAAIFAAYRLARGNEAKTKQVVDVLSKELGNPVMGALEANLFVLDRFTPGGDKALLDSAEQVRRTFVSQQAYKDRARLVEAFVGHLRARTK